MQEPFKIGFYFYNNLKQISGEGSRRLLIKSPEFDELLNSVIEKIGTWVRKYN